MACQLLWESRKLNKRGIPNKSGGLEYFWKKITGGGGGGGGGGMGGGGGWGGGGGGGGGYAY